MKILSSNCTHKLTPGHKCIQLVDRLLWLKGKHSVGKIILTGKFVYIWLLELTWLVQMAEIKVTGKFGFIWLLG